MVRIGRLPPPLFTFPDAHRRGVCGFQGTGSARQAQEPAISRALPPWSTRTNWPISVAVYGLCGPAWSPSLTLCDFSISYYMPVGGRDGLKKGSQRRTNASTYLPLAATSSMTPFLFSFFLSFFFKIKDGPFFSFDKGVCLDC